MPPLSAIQVWPYFS